MHTLTKILSLKKNSMIFYGLVLTLLISTVIITITQLLFQKQTYKTNTRAAMAQLSNTTTTSTGSTSINTNRSCEKLDVKVNMSTQSQCPLAGYYRTARISCDGTNYFTRYGPTTQACMTEFEWWDYAREICECTQQAQCMMLTSDAQSKHEERIYTQVKYYDNNFQCDANCPIEHAQHSCQKKEPLHNVSKKQFCVPDNAYSCGVDEITVLDNSPTRDGAGVTYNIRSDSKCTIPQEQGVCNIGLICNKIFDKSGKLIGMTFEQDPATPPGWQIFEYSFQVRNECPCQDAPPSFSNLWYCKKGSIPFLASWQDLNNIKITCRYDMGKCEAPAGFRMCSTVIEENTPIRSRHIIEFTSMSECEANKPTNWSCRYRFPLDREIDEKRYAVVPMCSIAGISISEDQIPPPPYGAHSMTFIENTTSCPTRSNTSCPDGFTCIRDYFSRSVTITNDTRRNPPELRWVIGDNCPCQELDPTNDNYFQAKYCEISNDSALSGNSTLKLMIGQSAVCDIDTLKCNPLP